jgi:hypothetical protein
MNYPAMTVARSIALFVVAALAEIGGAWLVWQGSREHRGVLFMGAGCSRSGRVRIRRDTPAGSPLRPDTRASNAEAKVRCTC